MFIFLNNIKLRDIYFDIFNQLNQKFYKMSEEKASYKKKVYWMMLTLKLVTLKKCHQIMSEWAVK
jgi:hypothetical protein